MLALTASRFNSNHALASNCRLPRTDDGSDDGSIGPDRLQSCDKGDNMGVRKDLTNESCI